MPSNPNFCFKLEPSASIWIRVWDIRDKSEELIVPSEASDLGIIVAQAEVTDAEGKVRVMLELFLGRAVTLSYIYCWWILNMMDP